MNFMPPPVHPASAGGYSEGPPGGLPTSPGDRYAAGTIDSRARNAAILGILGIFPLSILSGIPAIIVGAHALQRIDASDGTLRGRAAAWCGIVLGCLSFVVLALIFYSAHR
jgi:hypothetical protein